MQKNKSNMAEMNIMGYAEVLNLAPPKQSHFFSVYVKVVLMIRAFSKSERISNLKNQRQMPVYTSA